MKISLPVLSSPVFVAVNCQSRKYVIRCHCSSQFTIGITSVKQDLPKQVAKVPNKLFPQSGLPKLDDDGDECSFVEENEYDQLDGENHDQNHHGDCEAGYPHDHRRPEQRGFCAALKSCCCCYSEPLENSALGVDPENGTMALDMPIAKETCCEKFTDVWTWFRSHIKSFIYSFWFENGIMMCIVINTLCLALDSPNISEDLDAVLSKVNDVSF